VHYKGSFSGCQGQPSARPWHLLIWSLVLVALPPPLVRLSPVLGYCLPSFLYRPLPSTLLFDSCSACLLPTVHPGNTPHTTCLVKIVLNGRSSMRTLCPLYLVLTAIYIPKVGGVTLTAIRSCYSINTATRPVIGTEYVMRHLMRHTIAIKTVFSHTIRDNWDFVRKVDRR